MNKLRFLTMVAATVVCSNQVSAGTAVLGLNVTGNISGAPQWQDAGSSPITSITLDFTGFTQANASAPVFSNTRQAKINDANVADGNNVSVALLKPSACEIGGTPVSNEAHVILDVNGTQFGANGNITIPENTVRDFKLKFDGAANVGQATGAVSCTAGSLTYTF